MKNIRCENCGGTMVLDVSGIMAVCPFCGSTFLLDRADTDYYQEFFARMNTFFSAPKSEQERKRQAEALWEKAKVRTFLSTDGTPVEIKYMYCYTDGDAVVYVARRNIVFYFREGGAERVAQLKRSISLLDYPSADTRNLEQFFPKLSGGFALQNGGFLCVIAKDEDEYPLRLFGALPGRHAAWLISRLENLCCVLEFSDLVHPCINPDTVYINPYTHQASLYGGWWRAGRNNSQGESGYLQLRQNLLGLRKTAAETLGYMNPKTVKETEDIPEALAAFVRSDPRMTAYDDFGYWDEMLIKAYGKRKFIQMDTDDGQIYGR